MLENNRSRPQTSNDDDRHGGSGGYVAAANSLKIDRRGGAREGSGRPPGTLQNAASVLTNEIIKSTKLMSSTRELIGAELDKVRKELSDKTITMEVRLGVVKELTEIVQALGKAVGDAAKCLVVAKSGGETGGGEDIDVEAFLKREMLGRNVG